MLVIAGMLLAGCSPKPVTRHERMIADMQQYYETVRDAWAYRETKLSSQGVDIVEIRNRLLSCIREDATDAQFAGILQEFAASLRDGHSQVATSSLGPSLSRSWPVGFAVVKEGIVVANLNWLAGNPDIQLGDLLIRVNGTPIDEFLSDRMKRTSASTDRARQVLCVDRMHATDSASVQFTFERSSGEVFDCELATLSHPVDYRARNRTEFCTFTRLDGNLAFIRIPQFTWNEAEFLAAQSDGERDAALAEAKDQLDAAFDSAEELTGLILDLRGNAGGFELLSSYVAEHLVAGDFHYYTSTRHDSPVVRALEAYRGQDDSHFGRPIPQHPRRWVGFRHFEGAPFTKPLIVLINSRCFSTTDNLCAFLHDSRPQTQFVGTPTGGGTGEPMNVATLVHCRATVQLCVSRIDSPQGRLIEGTGTQPDILVEPTRDDLIKGHDAALEAARSRLMNQ